MTSTPLDASAPLETGSRPPNEVPPSAAQPLEDAVARALELRDAGRSDWLEAACADDPSLAPRVQSAVVGSAQLPSLFVDSSVQDRHLGRTLAQRFELQRRLGSGAMGVVYLARDHELHRNVAVKVLRPGLMDATESARRFTREAEAMASVRHGSVITIYDRGLTPEGEPFLVMEHIDGESLGAVVDEARRAKLAGTFERSGWIHSTFGIDDRGDGSYMRTVIRWVADLAAGLEAVHGAGVLHRDIKPSNVIVRRNGQPVLLDFGIALLDGDSTLTRGVSSVGTPSYMPPEALVQGRQRTPASDIYSLAATLHHLLALRPPYEGTPPEVLTAIAMRDPIPASKHAGGLPRDLQAILDKGMHRRALSRYRSAGAFEADLRAFLEHRPVVARPVGPLTRAARRLRRSRVAWGVALGLGLVALATGADAIRDARLEAREQRYLELARQLPPNFSIVGLTNREYRYDSDRDALARLLDSAVDASASPIPMRLLRSSFRLDHGDARGAAEDMSVVADHVGTPFARSLAEAYRALPADTKGHRALAPLELADAITTLDRYLLAYHHLRGGGGRDTEQARQLLEAADVRAIPHAEEMLLVTTPFTDLDAEEEYSRALDAYTATLQLEGRLGARTATTANYAAYLLDVMSRYDNALLALDTAVELAPRAHTIRINAGLANYALGRFDEARAHYEVAIDLRPNYFKPLQGLVWVLLACGEFDEAQRRLVEAPLDDTAQNRLARRMQLAAVETHRALAARRSGDHAASKQSVARATELLSGLEVDEGSPDWPTFRILAGLQADDDELMFVGLAELLASDPHNWWWIRSVLDHMPETLSKNASAAVRSVLESSMSRLATPAATTRNG